jgi:hypothetical protein
VQLGGVHRHQVWVRRKPGEEERWKEKNVWKNETHLGSGTIKFWLGFCSTGVTKAYQYTEMNGKKMCEMIRTAVLLEELFQHATNELASPAVGGRALSCRSAALSIRRCLQLQLQLCAAPFRSANERRIGQSNAVHECDAHSERSVLVSLVSAVEPHWRIGLHSRARDRAAAATAKWRSADAASVSASATLPEMRGGVGSRCSAGMAAADAAGSVSQLQRLLLSSRTLEPPANERTNVHRLNTARTAAVYADAHGDLTRLAGPLSLALKETGRLRKQ